MTIDINFEQNYRGVLLQAYDTVSGEELAETTRRVYGYDCHRQVQYQIVDLSNVDQLDIDMPTVRYIAHLDQCAAQKNGGMKIAVIVNTGSLEALTQSWADFSDGPCLHTRICRDMPTARSWISQADLEAMG